MFATPGYEPEYTIELAAFTLNTVYATFHMS